jgi:transcriptional regulator with XRE-family HTH domain
MSKRRGRPSGYTLNPDAFMCVLGSRSQARIAALAEISASHLSEMLAGSKGVTHDAAERLAAAMTTDDINVTPAVLFPEMATWRIEFRQFVVPEREVA